MLKKRTFLLFFSTFFALSTTAQAAVISVAGGDASGFQNALSTAPDGSIIELGAGTFAAPGGGFSVTNPGRTLTIRAAAGATVVLDGANNGIVFNYQVTNIALQGWLSFEDIIFRDGRTTTNTLSAGVTLNQAGATFLRCTFEGNVNNAPNTGGGGVGVIGGSTAFFIDSVFQDNAADNGGGAIRVNGESRAWVHNSEFLNNRVNLPGHRPSATGGGIDVIDSTLRVSHSRFVGNEAGFVGGAIYGLGPFPTSGSAPTADILVTNSTFEDNHAVPSAGINPPSPTEGGGIHVENQTLLRVYNSRLVGNSAQLGGALSSYRADIEVFDSVLRGNEATFPGQQGGLGGAIKVTSNDANDATTDFGAINRPSGSLIVQDSLLQGRFGGVTVAARRGGCIFAQGDTNRTFGNNPNVPQMGTPTFNRTAVVLDGVVFDDCDVEHLAGANGSGVGGAIQGTHVDLTISNSLLQRSDATGANGDGGALRLVTDSLLDLTNTTFAANSASRFGATVYVEGSDISIDGCQFFENELSPGVSEGDNTSFGASLFISPSVNLFGSVDINVTGTVANNVFSNNVGLDIWDSDRNEGPINDVRYNNNDFFNTTFGDDIYRNSLVGTRDVGELNTLTITRNGGVPSTVKSQIDNTQLSSGAVLGAILAVPPRVLPTAAAGDPAPPTEAFLGYAWTGGAATLDSVTVTGNAAVESDDAGNHTLAVVGGGSFMASIGTGGTPNLNLNATPVNISSGESSNLNWNSSGGTFLTIGMDQGINISTASGTTSVTPEESTTYTAMTILEEGGAVDSVRVLVDEAPVDLIFMDAFESGDTSQWTLTVP